MRSNIFSLLKRPCNITQAVRIIHIRAEHRVLILAALCHGHAPFACYFYYTICRLLRSAKFLSVKLLQNLCKQPFGEYAFARMPSDVRGVFHRERLGGEGAVGCG